MDTPESSVHLSVEVSNVFSLGERAERLLDLRAQLRQQPLGNLRLDQRYLLELASIRERLVRLRRLLDTTAPGTSAAYRDEDILLT